MKNLSRKIVNQMTIEQLEKVQEFMKLDQARFGDAAAQNIDELVEECQELYHIDETEMTAEDVIRFTQIDWSVNEGSPDDTGDWETGELEY